MVPLTKTVMKKSEKILLAVLILLLCVLAAIKIYPRYMHEHLMSLSTEVYGGMTDELRDSELYEDFQSGASVCFIGDSITDGGVIYGIPWYQPLTSHIKGDIFTLARSGWTVADVINHAYAMPEADVYIIAIGVNDVMDWDGYDCADTAEEYTERIQKVHDIISEVSPGAKMYFIAPWVFFDYGDAAEVRGNEFREALRVWCEDNGCIYINPVPSILSVIYTEGASVFMYNELHPYAPEGVGLYSYAVLREDHLRRVNSAS